MEMEMGMGMGMGMGRRRSNDEARWTSRLVVEIELRMMRVQPPQPDFCRGPGDEKVLKVLARGTIGRTKLLPPGQRSSKKRSGTLKGGVIVRPGTSHTLCTVQNTHNRAESSV